MRLLQLKIRNIASLKGEHEVNFDSIVKESPLFAITGDTGAGKSTLLNCIALSLYGEIYKKGVHQTDVITLGEKEGSIELLFQVQGKYYLAEWKGRLRKSNGELLKNALTDRNIFELEDSTIQANRVKKIESANKLLNLDFDQFCKCIILNQGEFARFLSSSFTERKDILEKLYPTGNLLESIGMQLKREIEILERNLAEVDIEYKTIIGSGPDVNVLQSQQGRIGKQLSLKKEWLDYLTDSDYHFTSLQNYHSKYLENSHKAALASSDIANLTSKLNELISLSTEAEEKFKIAQDKHQRELPKLQELLKKEQFLNTSRQQLKSLNEKQLQVDKLVSNINQGLEKLNGELEQWKNIKDEFNKTFHFDKAKIDIFQDEIDNFLEYISKKDVLSNELVGRKNRLKELENEGIQKTSEINELSKKLEASPANINLDIETLTIQKLEFQNKREQQQKSLTQLQECKSQIENIKNEIARCESIITNSDTRIQEIGQELLPIQTTLRLQSLFSAVEVCLNHPEVKDQCPVCETTLGHERLLELRHNLKKAEIIPLKVKEETLTKEQIKIEQVFAHTKEQIIELKSKLHLEQEKELNLANEAAMEIPGIEALEKKIVELQKLAWENEKTVKDLEKLNIERDKTRVLFSQTRKEIINLEDQLKETLDMITTFVSKFDDSTLLGNIILFKEDVKKFKIYKNHLVQGEKLQQDITHQLDLKGHHQKDLEKLKNEFNEVQNTIQNLSTILHQELGNQTASELITQLQELNRSLLIDLNKKQEDLKKQELQLKESNGRLGSLKELLKEIELLFEQEKAILRSNPIPKTNPEDDELNTLIKSIPDLGLTLQSPQELYLPLSVLIKNKHEIMKKDHHDLQLSLAEIKARLVDWEKRKDRLALLELKKTDLSSTLHKKQKLFEVLGRDEMRTYVLSVVEENLIIQTNEELQKLCQGRYEIIHQQKKQRLPEFFVMDKFREGGRRNIYGFPCNGTRSC